MIVDSLFSYELVMKNSYFNIRWLLIFFIILLWITIHNVSADFCRSWEEVYNFPFIYFLNREKYYALMVSKEPWIVFAMMNKFNWFSKVEAIFWYLIFYYLIQFWYTVVFSSIYKQFYDSIELILLYLLFIFYDFIL